MKKEWLTKILLIVLAVGILIAIAVFFYKPAEKKLVLPEDVNRISLIYGGENFDLDEEESKEVCSFFENLEFVKVSKTTQPAYTDGITVTLYNDETYLGKLYIYDINTIIVEEDSLMKYLTETDLLNYFAELVENLE